MKVSLHESGVCHFSALAPFFEQHRDSFESYGRTDRNSLRWRRNATPKHGPIFVMAILFAAYESWEPFWEIEDKAVTLLAPPKQGWGIQVNFLYSRDDPNNHCGGTPPEDIYIARFQLDNGDFVTLVPSPVEVSNSFFDETPLPKVPFISGLDQELDHRNIAAVMPLLFGQAGPLIIHSLHNMLMREMTIDEYEAEKKLKCNLVSWLKSCWFRT